MDEMTDPATERAAKWDTFILLRTVIDQSTSSLRTEALIKLEQLEERVESAEEIALRRLAAENARAAVEEVPDWGLARAFEGTSFGAWWAVAESAAQARAYSTVQSDPQLAALIDVLLQTASILSRGEDRHDPRTAL